MKGHVKTALFIAAGLLLMFISLGGFAQAQDSQDSELESLKGALKQMQNTINQLNTRIEELERTKAAAPPPPTAPAAIVVAPTVPPEEAKNRPRLDIYGFSQLDTIYDANTVDPSWAATLRPSKIPVICPGDPGCGKDGNTTVSVRQSKFGVKGFIPTELGEMKTVFEFDLFGVGSNAGQTTFRIRHVYGELGQVLAGQTNSLFMDGDVFPNVVDYWGPVGMIFVRNPQLRWTPYLEDGMKIAVALEAPSAAIDSGKVNTEIDPTLNVQPWTKYPDLTAQFRLDRPWGHAQLAGILRWIGYQAQPTATIPGLSGDKAGWGFNLTSGINTWGKDQLLMQVAYGDGIASYVNDGGVDLAPNGSLHAEAVPLLGWLAYYDHYWSEKFSSSIGYSETHQYNSDGQLATAFKSGQYFSTNLLFYPVKTVMFGVEYMWGHREDNDGLGGNDNRIQFSAKYSWDFKLHL